MEGREVSLTAKELLALSALQRRGGNLCSKDELARHVWPEFEGAVDDESIEQVISRLRRKIEPDPQHPRYLLTARGLGYRLLAEKVPRGPASQRPRWRPHVGRRPVLLVTALAFAAVVPLLLSGLLRGSDSSRPSVGAAAQGWVLTTSDDFGDAEKTAFPRGAGSTPAGLIFSRDIEGEEYVVRILKGPDRSAGVSSLAPPVALETFAFQAEARSNASIEYGLTLFWNSADSLQIRLNPVTKGYEVVHSLEGSLISREGSPLVKPGDSTNLLRFELRGDKLSVLINDTLAETVQLQSIGRRPVTPGLFLNVPTGRALSAGTKVVFDNFQVFAAAGQ